MRRQEAIDCLKRHEAEIRASGVGALYLFGSVANDSAKRNSDVDLFFDLDRPESFTLFSLVAMQERLQEILGTKVDLMTRKGIHPRRRSKIEASAVRIF